MDIARSGWCADYNDAFDFINVLLDGRTIQDSNNVNFAYLNNAQFNAKMTAASKLLGDARAAAYAKLDLEAMRDLAPWVPVYVPNSRYFAASRTSNVIHSAYFTLPIFHGIAVG
jgi:ABC-type oligopeptide transport system substrate-binding subunit